MLVNTPLWVKEYFVVLSRQDLRTLSPVFPSAKLKLEDFPRLLSILGLFNMLLGLVKLF
jgi:hypothetical protein